MKMGKVSVPDKAGKLVVLAIFLCVCALVTGIASPLSYADTHVEHVQFRSASSFSDSSSSSSPYLQLDEGTVRSSRSASEPAHTVVILTSGLRWDEFDREEFPALTSLAEHGKVANLIPLRLPGGTCPIDSWLAMSALEKATEKSVVTSGCPQPWVVPGEVLPQWDKYLSQSKTMDSQPKLGTFATALEDAGLSVSALGSGAAYVLADSSGRAPEKFQNADDSASQLAWKVAKSAEENDLTVVDADIESYIPFSQIRELIASGVEGLSAEDGLQSFSEEENPLFKPGLFGIGEDGTGEELAESEERSLDKPASGAQDSPVGGLREGEATKGSQEESGVALLQGVVDDAILAKVEDYGQFNTFRVQAILAAIPSNTRVIVASLTGVHASVRMQMVLTGGTGSERETPGLLRSPSVRQNGVLQLVDLAPTILSSFNITPPHGSAGAAVSSQEDECQSESCFSNRIDSLASTAIHAYEIRASRALFFRFLLWGSVVYFILSLLFLMKGVYKRISSPHFRGVSIFNAVWSVLGFTLAALPVASLLLNAFPWWLSEQPGAVIIAGSWALALICACLAYRSERHWRFSGILAIAAFTALLIAGDAATGSRMMADSPIGFNLLAAARYYGLGNEAYALMASGALISLGFLGSYLRSRLVSKSAQQDVDIYVNPGPCGEVKLDQASVRRSSAGCTSDSKVQNRRASYEVQEGTSIVDTYSASEIKSTNMTLRPRHSWIINRPVFAVGILGLMVAFIDAFPLMGADFGGILSFVPALILLCFSIARVEISWRKLFVAGLATVMIGAGVAFMDWLRPEESRTHLGKFFQAVIDGDLGIVLGAKLSTNIRLLQTSTYRWAVIAALFLLGLALIQSWRTRPKPSSVPASEESEQNGSHAIARRAWREHQSFLAVNWNWTTKIFRPWRWLIPSDDEEVRNLIPVRLFLPALGLCTVLAFALNDSGIVLPGMSAIIVIPLLMVELLQRLERRGVCGERVLPEDERQE